MTATAKKKTPDINEILARPAHHASSQYGARMGRGNQTQGEPEKLHLQRMRFVDGDYDTGGAYWGGNSRAGVMYCAFSPDDTVNNPPVRVFVRAKNRADAKEAVLDELNAEEGDGWTFFK